MRSYAARVGFVVAVSLLAALPAGAHSGAAGRTQCTGVAPSVTSCSNGLHNAFWTYDLGVSDQPVTKHGLLLYTNYIGSIESRLEWPAVNPSNVRSYRCDVRNGVVQGTCASSGLFPPPLVHFVHTCRSWLIGSPTLPGGTGSWGCFLDHDASPVSIPVGAVGG